MFELLFEQEEESLIYHALEDLRAHALENEKIVSVYALDSQMVMNEPDTSLQRPPFGRLCAGESEHQCVGCVRDGYGNDGASPHALPCTRLNQPSGLVYGSWP